MADNKTGSEATESMKVIFVNDCAYTSETIAKYLDKTEFQIEFIKRTREIGRAHV